LCSVQAADECAFDFFGSITGLGVELECGFGTGVRGAFHSTCEIYSEENPVSLWAELCERESAEQASTIFEDSSGRKAWVFIYI
jgi:hypothetical protein